MDSIPPKQNQNASIILRHLSPLDNEPSGGELHISAEASEWLFSIGFWDRVNSTLSTSFGQYKDDILDAASIEIILKLIEGAEISHLSDKDGSHDFKYGWTADGTELRITVENNALFLALDKFKQFLSHAHNASADVFCQL